MMRIPLQINLLLPIVCSCICSCAYIDFGPSKGELAQADKSKKPTRFQSSLLEQEVVETSKVEIEKLTPDDQANTLVEIIWEIPKDPVDGYIIHYGTNPEALSKTVRVNVADLEKYEDSRYGTVFRYIVTDVPSNRSTYVAMSSIRGKDISERTRVFKVDPIQKSREQKDQPGIQQKGMQGSR